MQNLEQLLNFELLLTQLVAWLPSLFAAIVMLILFWATFRLTSPGLDRVLRGVGLDPALSSMLLGVYRFSLLSFGVVMAAGQLGINIAAALAGLGVVGLSIGFAAKDSLGNIMAGFLIFWDQPFGVGDWISVNDYEGKVAEITMRTTRLRTRDNTWVIIPNQEVINHILVNHSTKGEVRLNVPIGIAYKEYIPEARRVLLEAIASVPDVKRSPAPAVVVSALGGSSVDLLVQVWIVNAEDEKPAYFRVLEACKLALDNAGIQIPYPHLQLFVDAVEDQVWKGASQLAAAGLPHGGNGSSKQPS
jgi:small conductance mechanosensitive channel